MADVKKADKAEDKEADVADVKKADKAEDKEADVLYVGGRQGGRCCGHQEGR